MHKDIMDLMKRVGLRERERIVYLICLQHRNGLFIHEIAKLTRITRSTVDLTARRLVQRGFLNKIKVGRRLRYMADAPEALLFRQKRLVEDLEQVMPMLGRLGSQKQETEVIYFEGNEGYLRVYEDILLNIKFADGEKKDLLSFSSGIDAMKLFSNMQKGFINKRIKNGSWYKAIAPRDSQNVREWVSEPKALRAVKYLPPEVKQFHMDTTIYADNVALYSPTAPIGGVIIRNTKIAEAMRSLFSIVWTLLPDDM